MKTFDIRINAFCIMIWPQGDVLHGVECSGLNTNISHRLRYLDIGPQIVELGNKPM